MNRIPLACPFFDGREMELLAACLESGHVAQGPLVARLESGIEALLGGVHALAVSSGTAALHLAVRALDIGPGDEVIVPAFTWVATAHAVEYAGARAVFADVDPATFNVTVQSVERVLSPRTRAIIPVHLFGLPAPMRELVELAQRYGLHVVEDAACAIGAAEGGAKAGTMGDIGCFSFHPRKNMTTGEGGMLVTGDDTLKTRLAALRNHGAISRGTSLIESSFEILALNFRMSDIQAALGCAQLEKLAFMQEARTRLALRYGELLRGTELALPVAPEGAEHVWQAYVVRVQEGGRKRRDAIMRYLADAGVETRAGTQAVHRLVYYANKYGLRSEDCPGAALCEDTSMALPLYCGMKEGDQDRVVQELLNALKQS